MHQLKLHERRPEADFLKKTEFVIANPAHRVGLFIGFLLKDINCAAPAPHI